MVKFDWPIHNARSTRYVAVVTRVEFVDAGDLERQGDGVCTYIRPPSPLAGCLSACNFNLEFNLLYRITA